MRLIDLHCNWALQYARESSQYDPRFYAEIADRLGQLDGYLMGTAARRARVRPACRGLGRPARSLACPGGDDRPLRGRVPRPADPRAGGCRAMALPSRPTDSAGASWGSRVSTSWSARPAISIVSPLCSPGEFASSSSSRQARACSAGPRPTTRAVGSASWDGCSWIGSASWPRQPGSPAHGRRSTWPTSTLARRPTSWTGSRPSVPPGSAAPRPVARLDRSSRGDRVTGLTGPNLDRLRALGGMVGLSCGREHFASPEALRAAIEDDRLPALRGPRGIRGDRDRDRLPERGAPTRRSGERGEHRRLARRKLRSRGRHAPRLRQRRGLHPPARPRASRQAPRPAAVLRCASAPVKGVEIPRLG